MKGHEKSAARDAPAGTSCGGGGGGGRGSPTTRGPYDLNDLKGLRRWGEVRGADVGVSF